VPQGSNVQEKWEVSYERFNEPTLVGQFRQLTSLPETELMVPSGLQIKCPVRRVLTELDFLFSAIWNHFMQFDS
jgi:hypothetical protein